MQETGGNNNKWWSTLVQRVGGSERRNSNSTSPLEQHEHEHDDDLEEAVVTVVVAPYSEEVNPSPDYGDVGATTSRQEVEHSSSTISEEAQVETTSPEQSRRDVPSDESPNDTTPESSTKKRRLSHVHWALIATTLLLLGLIAVAVIVPVLVVRNKNNDSAPPKQTTTTPVLDTAYLQNLRSILVPPILWTDTNAPQVRAVDFMAIHPPFIPISLVPKLQQRYTMLVMYFTNGGETWPLNPRDDECNWNVTTCNLEGEIVELNMTALDMTGTLVQEISLLAHKLTTVNLEKNRLEGSLPETLYHLTNLGTCYFYIFVPLFDFMV